MIARAEEHTNGESASKGFSRIPPQDLYAEQCLLGCVMLSPEIVAEMPGEILPADMYGPDHAEALSAAYRIRAAGRMPDAVELYEALEPSMGKERAGELCEEAMKLVPYGGNWRPFARLIRAAAIRRKLIDVATDLAECGWDPKSDVESGIADGDKSLRGILEGRAGTVAKPSQQIATDLVSRMTTPRARGLPTGFFHLDKMLGGGLRPGQLVILAARPSVGKSAFAGNVAGNVARGGTAVLFVTLEMTDEELMLRLVSREARLTADEIMSGTLEEYNLDAAMRGVEVVANWPLWIDERAGRTMTQIAALARLHCSRDGVGLIVVDYLQLIQPDDRKANRQEQVASISRDLKLLARSLEVPVIALAQLNRGIESRDDKTPRMSDLRESGAIEQDADIIAFLDRPKLYDPDAMPDAANIYVAKNRNGSIGKVELLWNARTMTFGDNIEEYTN
jgi:replicative DNA helicase